MLGRRRHDTPTTTRGGTSLAKGPALIVGSLLVAFGLIGLTVNSEFPSGTFPDGTVQGDTFLGFEVNGPTNFLLIAGGALLLFGAAQHLLAKTMSLIVGLALGAAAVFAMIDGNDALGLVAENNATKLGLAIAAVVLLVNALLPRVGRDTHVVHDRDVDGDREQRTTGRFRRDRDHDRDHDRDSRDDDHEPVRDEPTRVGVGPEHPRAADANRVDGEQPTTTRRGGMF